MRALALLLCLLALPAIAAPPSFLETQAKTRGVPVGAPGDTTAFPVPPMILTGVTRFRVTVCPPPGASFTQGAVNLYYYSPRLLAWSSDPNLNLFVVTGTADLCTHMDYYSGVRYGFLYPATSNLATNPAGATGVRVSVEADSFGL